MSLPSLRAPAKQYGLIVAMLALSWFISARFADRLDPAFLRYAENADMLLILLGIVIVLSLGFIVYELARPTVIPSFVLALFFGIVTQDILAVLTRNPLSINTLVTIGAVLILFGGGLETPFVKFKQLLWPILSIALLGTVLTAAFMSLALSWIFAAFGVEVPVPALALLGAALASTDPAAIIPSLQSLLFAKPRIKHIAVSESAINDAVGAVLVALLLAVFHDGATPETFTETYGLLLGPDNLVFALRVVAIGLLVGVAGFLMLQLWSFWKQRVQQEAGTDAALFLAVPLCVFAVTSVFGGVGFLAVFITGLLFSLRSHVRNVELYFNHTVEGFMKPLIFILLGAMVDPAMMLELAGAGIVAGLVFMLVLRPLVVFLTLGPFRFTPHKFTLRELLFLSFVRETGVIPAVLLITISLTELPGSQTIGAVGLWVILLTLVIEPPLTPFVARWLKVAKDCSAMPMRRHAGPVAVLCSRGYSFPERMNTVVDWARGHGVDTVILLHCPEEKYSQEFVADVRVRAEQLFRSINHHLTEEGEKEINFEFLCGPGLLQDNIESLIAQGDVSIIFVGARMLDYRMEDVKRLDVPFYFMP